MYLKLLFFLILSTVTTFAAPTDQVDILLERPSVNHYYYKIKMSFVWKSFAKGIDKYVFTVSKDRDHQKTVYKLKTKKNVLVFDLDPEKLEEGKYYYVRITSEDGRYTSNTRGFRIRGEELNELRNVGLFYMASNGIFRDKTSNGASLIEEQNSPATLGIFYSLPSDSNFSYSASGYVSYFNDIEVLGSNKKLSIPLEIGLNAFLNYSNPNSRWSFSLGPEYERFSAFNTDEVSQNLEEENVVRQDMVFLSLGLARFGELFGRGIFAKLTLSHSIANYGEKSTVSQKNYSGYKTMLYGQYNLFKKVYLHGFYKIHLLTGPSDLLVTRAGVGFGYRF